MVVGESSQPPVKDTTLTFQCPILTSTNYTIWRMRMEVLLGIHGVWDVVDPGSDDAKKNNIVKGLLFQSIPEDLILQIGNLKTGKEMWEAIKTRNLGADRVKEARLQTLITEFENLKMLDNGTIDEYAAKLSGIASKSATLGEVMSEHKLVKKFLTSLPRRFVHIVAALEQVLDLKTTGFEDVVGRLKAYEERVKEEDKANDPQENLLYARTEYSNGNNDSSGGRGRGSYSRGRGRGRGQGRGRDNSQNQGQRDSSKNREDNEQKGKQHEKRDLSHIQCYRCDQYGHFVSKCPERNRNHEVNLNETQEKGVYHEEGTFFMMNHIQETIFMNEEKYTPPKSESNTDDEDDVWYFDNGASNHMTGNYSYFSELNENITGRVSQKSEEDKSGSDDMSIPIARLQTIRLLIALATGRGWKIHHFDAVYRKVPNGEFIIVVINVDDIFVTGISLDLINQFKRRMASHFEMSDLGELTYYLGIEVSQGKDCIEIKQDRYAMKILKEAGIEDFIATLCPMESGLKLSKAKDEPQVEATQYRKMTRFLSRYITYYMVLTKGNYRDVIFGEAEFMAATVAACQAIWLRKVLVEVMDNEQVIVEHVVSGENQRAYLLTKALACIRFKEMRSLFGVLELPSSTQKFMGVVYFKQMIKIVRMAMEPEMTMQPEIAMEPKMVMIYISVGMLAMKYVKHHMWMDKISTLISRYVPFCFTSLKGMEKANIDNWYSESKNDLAPELKKDSFKVRKNLLELSSFTLSGSIGNMK
ncbi:uncharacterized mitochondrial protein-like protein [Tanacetum coccineum]